jgi:hypothetical protein
MIARSRTFDALRRGKRHGVLQGFDESPVQTIEQHTGAGETKLCKRLQVGGHIKALPASHRELIRLAEAAAVYRSASLIRFPGSSFSDKPISSHLPAFGVVFRL